MSSLSRSLIAVVFPVAILFSPGARADPVLLVEQVIGKAHVDHLGQSGLLVPGEALYDRDVLRLDDDAYLLLRFSRDGALELGPGTSLAIERLPADSETADLRTIFSLWQGYLHVVWRHPPSAPWPLYVYFGGQRSSLVDGEYFFERDGPRARSCVAAGRLAVTAISGNGVETLRPSACYEMLADGNPKIQLRTIDSWIAVRRSFALDPDPARQTPVFASRSQQGGADTVTSPAAVAITAAPAPAEPKSAATVPVPVAELPASADAASSPTGGWAILIGSYADPQNAAQVQQKLISAGFTPYLRIKILDGRTWNSVQVRGFMTREAAQEKMAEITARFSLPNLKVVSLSP